MSPFNSETGISTQGEASWQPHGAAAGGQSRARLLQGDGRSVLPLPCLGMLDLPPSLSGRANPLSVQSGLKRDPKIKERVAATDPGMEGDGSDKVDVLEAAETLPPGYVPEPDGLIHGRREQEVILWNRKQTGGLISGVPQTTEGPLFMRFIKLLPQRRSGGPLRPRPKKCRSEIRFHLHK